MGSIKRTKYSKEFEQEAVRLVGLGQKSQAQVARDLGVSDKTLWNWVHRAAIDAGRGKPGELTTDEREELRKLRREVAVLREEKEILKKATAFFAKESK
jgi:transposase